MSKTKKQMSAEVGTLVQSIGPHTYSALAAGDNLRHLLYDDRWKKVPDPILSGGGTPLGCIKKSVAWRYLHAGCDPAKVCLDGLEEAYKTETLRISQRRAETLRKMREKHEGEGGHPTPLPPPCDCGSLACGEQHQELVRRGALERELWKEHFTPAHNDRERLRGELCQLRERNAALEQNTLHVQAELERRQDELVSLGQRLDELEARAYQLVDMLEGEKRRNEELLSTAITAELRVSQLEGFLAVIQKTAKLARA